MIEITGMKETEVQIEIPIDQNGTQGTIEIEIEAGEVIETETMTKEIEKIAEGETDHQQGETDLDHLIAVTGIEIVRQIGN